MLNTLKNRFEQGYKTTAYPKSTIELVERYRGLPEINDDITDDVVKKCAAACPQDAIDEQKKNNRYGALCILWKLRENIQRKICKIHKSV